jgi:hypothetical protein
MAGSLPRGLTGLTQLTFNCYFNQPVAAGVLPAGLTKLEFGICFDQPMAVGVLPVSLTQLTFGACNAADLTFDSQMQSMTEWSHVELFDVI